MHWLIDDSCMYKLCIMEDTNFDWRLDLGYNRKTCDWCCSLCLFCVHDDLNHVKFAK
jgi:hypothetical protein